MAAAAFNRLLYGDHILAANARGSVEALASIGIEDLQRYYKAALVPQMATFHVAGAVSHNQVVSSLEGISARWEGGQVSLPEPQSLESRGGLFFVDVPGAKQSVVQIGYLALAENDPEFYPAAVMNFRLGGGGFASDLTQALREQKGYTYGIRSGFQGTDLPGPFFISSRVRSNVTLEALQLIKEIVERFGPEFDDSDLEATQSFLLKSNAMAFETLSNKIGILADMSAYGFSANYVLEREAIVREMTGARVGALAERYLDPNKMVWLVVGDARTQQSRLSRLGLGEPVLVDRRGESIPETN